MNNKQVIPQVGQVWINNRTKSETELKLINLSAGEYFFNTNFTFKPANDLEWLVCNVDKWYHDDCDYVRREGDSDIYVNSKDVSAMRSDYYNRQQWQDKRNELFGETEVKPKMKVSYEQCTIEEAANYHIRELFFHWSDEKIEPLSTVDAGSFIINQHKLCRRIETPVTWQGEAREHNISLWNLMIENFATDEIKSMCHLVASMTDKPE